ncbi:Short-chain dehydrogenase reductase 3c [Diplonema papillatum]|nr:Short-chain dehydrogenase reductase 3c [Diplonema papillatum]
MKVEGKVCIVTGGASGIGAALCEVLGEKSARLVIAVDMDEEGAAAVCAKLQEKHPKTKFAGMACDVRREDNIWNLVRAIKDQHGVPYIDLFIANAGVIGPMGGPEALDEAAWNSVMAVNVMQAIHAAKVLLPDMLAIGHGGFIITASAAGLLLQIGSIGYTVTKRAAVSVAEYLAIMYGAQGISVSCLCPQAVRTPMIAQAEGGGVAGVDGILDAIDVARETIDTFEAGRFLVLPHKNVGTYVKRKAQDTDAWIKGMQKLAVRTGGGVRAPQKKVPAKL